ncbi:MAG: cell division protein FtsK, partial [Desertifilum sp. SIO1I2]|nr:cell division protein FtsK [Desertifilum sp. SIO1I2]
MRYLRRDEDIEKAIAHLAGARILWLDTEVADWNTPNPRLSLIQATANPDDRTGEDAYILDVLDKPSLSDRFIQSIMVNPEIEKVFHNSGYDLKFLGRQVACNVTCTLKQ